MLRPPKHPPRCSVTAQTSPAQPTTHSIDRLYRIAAGDRMLAGVLALTALALLLSLVLPQAPPESAQQSSARWLAETAGRYGGFGAAMQAAGLFDLWHSLWLRALLGLLAFILLLRLGLAAAEAWQRLRRPDPAQAALHVQRWPWRADVAVADDAPTAAAELGDDLRSEGWRVASAASEQATHLVAERSRAGVLAAPLFYLGLLAVLAGLWLGQWAGWREAGVILAPGQPVRLSQDDNLVLALQAEQDSLLVQRDGGQAQERSLAALGAANAAGVWIRRTGSGQALIVSAQDLAGAVVPLQAVERRGPPQGALTLVFDQPRAEQVFLAPSSQLVFSVVAFPALPEQGFSGPAYLVQAFPADQQAPITNQFIQGDANLAIGDTIYTLSAGRFMVVEVSRNPGLPVIIAGVALALLAAGLALWRPAGRLAVTVQSQRHGASVSASLQASPLWRQAQPWLAAWAATYSREGQHP